MKSNNPHILNTISLCKLALPYNATCVLCLKEYYKQEIYPDKDIKLNNSKSSPMQYWLLRQHIIYAMQHLKNIKNKDSDLRMKLLTFLSSESTFNEYQESAYNILSIFHE